MYTIFIQISAQPRISAHPKGKKVNKCPASNMHPPPPHPPPTQTQTAALDPLMSIEQAVSASCAN